MTAKTMSPQIEFTHVLRELSVNRNDPCEILREMISNSYDAGASNIFLAPLDDVEGLVFYDDGCGLSIKTKINGITPWEAFFSIGKSTKKKGSAIGYKCQGSKLCLACTRILVATRDDEEKGGWLSIIVENPRSNLNTSADISPKKTTGIRDIIYGFLTDATAKTSAAIDKLGSIISDSPSKTATIIVIERLDTEQFSRYFSLGARPEENYAYNYIRFNTCHGNTRAITKQQGFLPAHVNQLSPRANAPNLSVFNGDKTFKIPFGFPYLTRVDTDPDIKSPAQISRLRDGRFFARSAKAFSVGASKYHVILAIDGNRRALDEYKYLDRRGATKSGIRLGDQRGLFISVKGIKICKYLELFNLLPKYQVLAEGDNPGHYMMVIDGEFDLVTNRNSLSRKAFDDLSDPTFVEEIRSFLDTAVANDNVFSELISRLRRESSDLLLNEQINVLSRAKERLLRRERFKIESSDGQKHLFLSPLPGEEYLVGVLYAVLGEMVPLESPLKEHWKKVVTFSTQGIDSLGLQNANAARPLADKNVRAIEYKYEFGNSGPFNHALAIVDAIVAWDVQIDEGKQVKDNYTCFGSIEKAHDNEFEWIIDNIEDAHGGEYPDKVQVLSLRGLIQASFPKARFSNPEE